MKRQLFITIFIIIASLKQTKSQSIDSVFWNNTSMPHSIFYSSYFNQGEQIKYVDQYLISDTVFIDFIFTHCAGPLTLYPFDTLLNIPSSVNNSNYNFIVRVAFDSNSIVGNNCFVHPRLYDTVFQHYIPVGIEDLPEYSNRSIKLWPNPTKDIAYLESLDGDIPKLVKVYSFQGRLLKTIPLVSSGNKQKIDLKEFNSGLYFLQTNKGMLKILKE
jgi:hypothetical protein